MHVRRMVGPQRGAQKKARQTVLLPGSRVPPGLRGRGPSRGEGGARLGRLVVVRSSALRRFGVVARRLRLLRPLARSWCCVVGPASMSAHATSATARGWARRTARCASGRRPARRSPARVPLPDGRIRASGTPVCPTPWPGGRTARLVGRRTNPVSAPQVGHNRTDPAPHRPHLPPLRRPRHPPAAAMTSTEKTKAPERSGLV